MKNSLLKEILLVAIAIAPLAYLGLNYAAMPEIVPTHFDGEGVANGFSPKSKLWFFTGLLAAISYGLMLILPKLDPKKNFDKFESSYFALRVIIVILMSAIGFFLVKSAVQSNSGTDISYVFIAISLALAAIGNYMQTVKPNYFVGIRTPWTLESKDNWKQTHSFGGKMMFYGFLLTAILLFFVPKSFALPVFLVAALGSAFVPVVYSYLLHRKSSLNPSPPKGS